VTIYDLPPYAILHLCNTYSRRMAADKMIQMPTWSNSGNTPPVSPGENTWLPLVYYSYPNIGKSSFINKVTPDVDVLPYTFTTRKFSSLNASTTSTAAGRSLTLPSLYYIRLRIHWQIPSRCRVSPRWYDMDLSEYIVMVKTQVYGQVTAISGIGSWRHTTSP
jgi:hypothetical protein